MANRGNKTKLLGKKLSDKCRNKNKNDYEVYHDHDDSIKNKNVVRCKGFFCDKKHPKITNANWLVSVDIMIAKGEKVKYLIEIEETSSSPKKIIGDIMTIAMCNKIAIKNNGQKYYEINKGTTLIIGGIANEKGKKTHKLDLIKKFLNKVVSISEELFYLNKIEYIFEDNIDSVIKKVIEKI